MTSLKWHKRELTEKDFEGSPITEEPEGTFQIIFGRKRMFLRNVDTGEIIVRELEK